MKAFFATGPIFIIIAALLWSFDGLLRVSLYTLPPAVVVFYEHLFGLIFLLPIFFKKFHELKTLSRKEWISIALVSLFSGALGTILYTAALSKINYIQFSVVVLLQQLQPLWAILTASVLLKEKLTKRFLGWAVLAIVASYFVTFKDMQINLQTGDQTAIAGLFALLAGVMWAVSTSFSKIVLKKVSFTTATFLRFLLAPIFAFLIVLLFNQTTSLNSINITQFQTLLAITLSTGMVALLIYYYGLKKTPARVSAICELIWPASAIAIDYFYFHRMLSVSQILGVGVLLFAMYQVTRLKK